MKPFKRAPSTVKAYSPEDARAIAQADMATQAHPDLNVRWEPLLHDAQSRTTAARLVEQVRMIWPGVLGPLLALVCATMLWAAALPGVDLSRMNDLGLVSVLPPATYVALIVLTVGYCLVVHQRQAPMPIALLHVIMLIIMIHGTPAILYGTLRYSWAWKHVGIVDYIQRHGSVKPDISFLNAYHNWPGFFALSALITEVAGFKSALSFAAWAPVFFNLLDLGALLLIFKTCTHDRRLIWLSVWFFYLTNWVGQDYFSPQALSYFLHLVILGICVAWFRVTTPPAQAAIKRWLVFDRAVYLFQRLLSRAASRDAPDTVSPPLQHTGLMMIIILLFAVVVSSHQLTPFMMILATAALVLFQRCSARSLPVLMASLTMTWIVYMAVAFLRGNLHWIVESFGQAAKNANSTLINLSQVSPGQVVVAYMSRGLTAFLWGLAVLGLIRRLRQGYWDLSCLLLAIVPFLMLASNSYSGEMLFRVYFFSLPFMAFFAASLLYPSPAAGTTPGTVTVTALLSGALLVGLCFAYYGKERMYHFTKNEVSASQYLYSTAPQGSLFLDVTWSYPWAFHNYEYYTYQSLLGNISAGTTSISKTQQLRLLRHPVEVISQMMEDGRYTAAYLIITRSQNADVEESGLMPAGSLDRIERALMQSGRFKVILANHDATIFKLAGSPRGAGQRSIQAGGR
jgi:hypothetical protein